MAPRTLLSKSKRTGILLIHLEFSAPPESAFQGSPGFPESVSKGLSIGRAVEEPTLITCMEIFLSHLSVLGPNPSQISISDAAAVQTQGKGTNVP